MSFCASLQVFCLSFLLFGSKYGGIPKISFLGTPKAGEKQCMDKRERKKERKYVITMASYACKRNHGWRTQTTWTKIFRLYLVFLHRVCFLFHLLCHCLTDTQRELNKNILALIDKYLTFTQAGGDYYLLTIIITFGNKIHN